jgi:anti-anti-sigma regulatory factor
MVDEPNQVDDAPMIALDAVMDLTTAADLKKKLLDAMGKGKTVTVDAANVQRITTPCLQVLVAAARDVRQDGGVIKFLNVPDVFQEPASILGLSGPLGLTEV